MSNNPRNKVSNEVVSNDVVDSSNWKTMTLGSLSLKGNDGKLLREGKVDFTINARNAEIIRDAAQFILENSDEKITISAGTFFEDARVSDNVKKYFSHRLYISADTVAKFGKTLGDYVKTA